MSFTRYEHSSKSANENLVGMRLHLSRYLHIKAFRDMELERIVPRYMSLINISLHEIEMGIRYAYML